MKHFIKTYSHEIILGAAICLFVAYFTTVSILRYEHFYAGRFDLGNMSQTVWNTTQGRLFQLTDPNGTDVVSRLATHADFILLVFAPLYALFPSPITLLVIQTIVVSLGAIFVYLIARKALNTKHIALFFGILYLLNPSLQRSTIYDFHSVVLATTFLLGAWFFLVMRKYGWFLLFALLAAFTKEDIWLTASFFGVYLFFVQKKYAFGALLFIIFFSIFSFLSFYAIPHAANANHLAVSYYYEYGASTSDIAKNILLHPITTLQTITGKEQQSYLFQLGAPVGFLPLIFPWVLLFIAPQLGLYLLSSNSNLHQIYYQYTAVLTPFIFISAISGVRLLLPLRKFEIVRYAFPGVFAFCLIMSFYYSPLPGSKEPNLAMFTRQHPQANEIKKQLQAIPDDASVAASNVLGAHLSNREFIYTIPVGTQSADFLAFLVTDSTSQKEALRLQTEMVTSFKQNPAYRLIYEKGSFSLFRKNTYR